MKLLFLDRDGTLNRSRDDYVASPDEWEALPGALEAVARLNQARCSVPRSSAAMAPRDADCCTSAPFHQTACVKSRLLAPCVVATPRHSTSFGCGARLA